MPKPVLTVTDQFAIFISICDQISVRLKPLFWFRSDTETHIGRYFRADTVTDTETKFQGKNLVTNFFPSSKDP